jgi:hypothetical protein
MLQIRYILLEEGRGRGGVGAKSYDRTKACIMGMQILGGVFSAKNIKNNVTDFIFCPLILIFNYSIDFLAENRNSFNVFKLVFNIGEVLDFKT